MSLTMLQLFLWGLGVSGAVYEVVARGCLSTVFANENWALDFDMAEFFAFVANFATLVWHGKAAFWMVGRQCFRWSRERSRLFFGYDWKGVGGCTRLHCVHESYHVSE